MFQAFNNYVKTKVLLNAQFNKITASNLIDLIVCTSPVEDCFLGDCAKCNNITPSSILGCQLDTSDEDDKCSWSIWKLVDKKLIYIKYVEQLHHYFTKLMKVGPHF